MTKITILGQEPTQKKELKPIEFIKSITTSIKTEFIETSQFPHNWENITLIQEKFSEGLDLMFAYDVNRVYRGLFLGHFNDGIV